MMCLTRGYYLKYIRDPHSSKSDKQLDGKVERGSKSVLFQRRNIDDQQVHEKLFNITSYKANANQNYNELSLHTYWTGHYQKDKK